MYYGWIAATLLLVVMLGLSMRLVHLAMSNTQEALEGAKKYKAEALAWKGFAQHCQDMAVSREAVTAVLGGKDFAFEHPDPSVQAEANRMMTNMRRLARKVRTADAMSFKDPSASN